uniref:Lipocalin-2 1 n=1 Tax=Amblyomma triste TaxID=251400 RepID=A0A023GAQ8_AMBTT
MIYFTAALLVPLVAMACGESAARHNLPQAIHTEERIWITMTTDGNDTDSGKNRCYYTLFNFQEGSTFEFDEYYKERRLWRKNHLYGNVNDPKEGKSSFTVQRQQGTEWRDYIVEFWDDNTKCAVLSYTKDDVKNCQIIVWESKLPQSGYQFSCEKKYDEICEGLPKHSLYEHDCLRQRDEFLREESDLASRQGQHATEGRSS